MVSIRFLGQSSGVLDPLLADPTPTGLLSGIVSLGGPAAQHAAGREPLPEMGEVGSGRVVGELWFFLGVEVVEVAVELIEPVHRGQVLVAVS
jgi:hypothetical protein